MIIRLRTLVLYSLRVPLLCKVVLANCALTALLGVVVTVAAVHNVQAQHGPAHDELIILFLAVSIAVSFTFNLIVMWLVLAPLGRLAAAINGSSPSRPSARTPSLITEEQIDHLAAEIKVLQNTLQESTQRARSLAEQVLVAQEAERQRIARELHDEAAQTLTTVLLYLKLLEKSCDPDEAQRLQNLRKLITHALNDIRRIAMELRPTFLDEWGLEAALAQRVDELNAGGANMVTLQMLGSTRERLPREVELTFYRVAQEALNNVAHHSHAHCAQVALKREADCLTLEVQDDGIGFDPDTVKSKQIAGLGLAGMRERLDLVSGELTIESRPGRGTRICARAPLSTLSARSASSMKASRN